MIKNHTNNQQQVLEGTIWNLIAESLMAPSGLILAAILTRKLGPEDYGVFILITAIINWIEWTIVSIFSRTTVKFTSTLNDWESFALHILRISISLSFLALIFTSVLTKPITFILKEPRAEPFILLYVLDIPLFVFSQTYLNILIGIRLFRERALATIARYTSKLIISVLLVFLGFSIHGAIGGVIGSSLITIIVVLRYLHLPLFRKIKIKSGELWTYALPLSITAINFRLYDRIPIFFLKILGGSSEEVGYIGAIQNLAILPLLIANSFTPVLLSLLSRKTALKNDQQALDMVNFSLKIPFLLLPIGGIIASCADPIVPIFFGPEFIPASGLLKVVIFSTLALLTIQMCTTILLAYGKPNWNLIISSLMIVIVSISYILFLHSNITALKIAWITSIISWIGAIISLLIVYQVVKLGPNIKSIIWCIFTCCFVMVIGNKWNSKSWAFILEGGGLFSISILILYLTGELKHTKTLIYKLIRKQD